MSRVNIIRNIVTRSTSEARIYSKVRTKKANGDSLKIDSGLIGQSESQRKCVLMLDTYQPHLKCYSLRNDYFNLTRTLCMTSTFIASTKSPLRLQKCAFHSRRYPDIVLAKNSEDRSTFSNDDETITDYTSPQKLKEEAEKADEDVINSEKQAIGHVKSTHMRIVYTCKVCGAQNTNTFAKSSYTHGVVIVTCQGCQNNHLIADNLGWFKDVGKRNIEEILLSKGEKVKKILTDSTLEVKDSKEDA